MKVLNTNKNWTYKMVCNKFHKESSIVTRINCDIITFTNLLNDPIAIKHFDPITKMAVLATGHYANLEVDGQWLEVHVDRTTYKSHSLEFV